MTIAAGQFSVNFYRLPVGILVVDVLFVGAFLAYVAGAYRAWVHVPWVPERPSEPPAAESIDELMGDAGTAHAIRVATKALEQSSDRTMGAQSVGTFMTVSTVAAASMLLAAGGVLLGAGPHRRALPPSVLTELSVTMIWLVGSLICGVLVASYVMNHLSRPRSVAQHPLVTTALAAQQSALLIGGASFVISVFLV